MFAMVKRWLKRVKWNWPRLSLSYYRTDDYSGLCLFRQYIRLCKREDDGSSDGYISWGFSIVEGQVYLTWGKRHRFITLPWVRVWYKDQVLGWDGRFEDRTVPSYEENDHRYHLKDVPFTYRCARGEVQHTTVDVREVTLDWRRRRIFEMLRLPWCQKTQWLDLQFKDEMGSERGSWKGGTIGCSAPKRADESVMQALTRFERESVGRFCKRR